MGVDTVMFVRGASVADAELKRLAYDFASAFGDFAWVSKEHGHRALNRDENGDIGVSTMARYYGIGYERGPLVQILAAARWLEARIPNGTVYYGGDDDDDIEPFTAERQAELWNHFVQVATAPYHGGWGKGDWCDWCEAPMRDYSWCGNETKAKCPACDTEKTRTRTP